MNKVPQIPKNSFQGRHSVRLRPPYVDLNSDVSDQVKVPHMIETYSSYIDEFLTLPRTENRPVPGEHHFVSSYLVPRIYAIRKRVPEYINPDGTKGINGDVVYYDAGQHQHGIEVKLGKIRLTSGEFNNWIVSTRCKYWPECFLALGSAGIALCSWSEFRDAYIKLIQLSNGSDWEPKEIAPKKYGPIREVNALLPLLESNSVFHHRAEQKQAASSEESFIEALRGAINC